MHRGNNEQVHPQLIRNSFKNGFEKSRLIHHTVHVPIKTKGTQIILLKTILYSRRREEQRTQFATLRHAECTTQLPQRGGGNITQPPLRHSLTAKQQSTPSQTTLLRGRTGLIDKNYTLNTQSKALLGSVNVANKKYVFLLSPMESYIFSWADLLCATDFVVILVAFVSDTEIELLKLYI